MHPSFINNIYTSDKNGFSVKCYVTNVLDDNIKYLCKVASQDPKNKWKDNYTNINKIKNASIFFLYVMVNDQPYLFWSMDRPDTLPSNVGRILSRSYQINTVNNKECPNAYFCSDADAIVKNSPISRQSWRDFGEDFPITYKHYMTLFGLDQVFFTRNYIPNRNTTVNFFTKRCKVEYKLLDKIKIYRSVPQYIYYTGKKETFDMLKNYEC